jgi:hypothetical protein
MGRCQGHRRENKGSDHRKTKKSMEKPGLFHKNDPPLIVEIIVEARRNALMIGL